MKEIKIFDSHAHYDDEAFEEDRENLLTSMQEGEISHIINVGADLQTSKNSIALAEKYAFIYASVGFHPQDAAAFTEDSLYWLKEQSSHEKVVAIGEVGLDYYWNEPEREVQKRCFEQQIELAKEVGLPLIIHSRDAAQDTFEMLKKHDYQENKGVVHCFSYGKEMTQEFLKLGLWIGIGGVVTFSNAKKLKEAVLTIPLERILLETDCPYLSPTPFRGKRNSSLNLPLVAREIAQIKGIDYEEVIATTCKNAKEFYGIRE